MSNLDIIKKENGDINFSNSGGGITLNNKKILTLDEVYPVGSIYITTSTTSPASFIGGTWELLKDRFLVGAGNLYSGGAMGGEATHTLTQGEMPNHNHIQRQADWQGSIKDQLYLSNGGNKYGTILEAGNWINGTGQGYITTTNTGGDQPHNNLPPYLAVFIWKRTG